MRAGGFTTVSSVDQKLDVAEHGFDHAIGNASPYRKGSRRAVGPPARWRPVALRAQSDARDCRVERRARTISYHPGLIIQGAKFLIELQLPRKVKAASRGTAFADRKTN